MCVKTLITLVAATALWAMPGAAGVQPAAPSASAPAPGQAAQIDRNGVLILIRTTLLAVDAANKTGNYTVLRDLGAPGFQAGNTAARLGEIFANLRAQNLDLSGIAVLDPQLTTLPTIGSNGVMRMAGFFPSVPLQINFELLYTPVESRWRLFGIGISLGQSGPVAPSAPPASPEAERQGAELPEKPKTPLPKR